MPLNSEIEHALARSDTGRREERLRQLSDLFVEQSATLAESHIAVFDEVIQRLSQGIEFRVRVELAEKLCKVQNAPAGAVRALAFDEHIEVAAPVIRYSPRLTEDDLTLLAEQRGQEHLSALSRRATLSKRVTDVLVRRGDEQVVRLVAENDGAEFSQTGFPSCWKRRGPMSCCSACSRRAATFPRARWRSSSRSHGKRCGKASSATRRT